MLKRINKKFYEKKYSRFIWAHYSEIYRKRLLKKVFKHLNIPTKKVNVLDLGCGTAEILKIFNIESHLTCIDFSKNGIKQAKKNLIKYPNKEFIISDLEDILNFRKKFDIILCSHVLEHLADYKILLRWCLKHTTKYLIIVIPINEPNLLEIHSKTFNPNHIFKMVDRKKIIFNKDMGSIEKIFDELNGIKVKILHKVSYNFFSILIKYIGLFDDVFKIKRNKVIVIKI